MIPSGRWPYALLLPMILPLAAQQPASVQSRFPSDANVLDVRSFGAKGDGIADDTNAINRAIAASGQSMGYSWWHDRLVYLPRGRYRVTAPLLKRYENGSFGSGLLLIGDGVGETTLALADHAAGYEDPSKPRAIVFTSSQLLDRGGPYGGGKDYPKLGEGNDAYENFVESLTIDAGTGNPGAIGIDYLANNLGAVRHVRLVGHDGSGVIALLMTRKWIGPAILEDVEIDGFREGIDIAGTEYGLTLDQIRLHGQIDFALRNRSNMLSAKNLQIQETGDCRGVINDTPAGLILLVQSHIVTTPPNALENRGTIVMRQSIFKGLAPALSAKRIASSDGVLTEATWKTASPWSLPLLNAPVITDPPAAEWVSVAAFGAKPDPTFDSTEAFRHALLSGARTVYVPIGIYGISGPLTLPPTLHHLAGFNAALRLLPTREANFLPQQGMLRVLAPTGEPLLIDRLGLSNSAEQIAVEVAGARTVVLRDMPSSGINFLSRSAGGGEVFLDDVCCGGMRLAGSEPVSAEQFDTEGPGVRILNADAPLSILGLKTERPNVVLQQGAGARSEIMGGLLYMVLPNPNPGTPAFSIIDSTLVATFVEEAFAPDRTYSFYAAASEDGKQQNIPRTTFPAREGAGSGRIVPLLTFAPRTKTGKIKP